MIVGLNCGHDAGVAYLKEEENKIYNFEFERNIGIKNVCGGNEKSFSIYAKKITSLDCNYLAICDFFAGKCHWLPEEINKVELTLNVPIKKINISWEERNRLLLKKSTEVYAVKHHLAHAASTFFTSPYEKAMIITVDGSSKNAESFTVGIGEKNKINILEIYTNILGPRFGAFYEKFSKRIFGDKFSAGKLMGLSAYGEEIHEIKDLLRVMLIPNIFREKIFSQKIELNDDVILRIGERKYIFNFEVGHHFDLTKVDISFAEKSIFNDVFEEIYIGNRIFRFNYDYNEKSTKDLAFTIQKVFQEEMLNIIKYFSNKYKYKTLCLAGGSFLNIISNSQLSSLYDNIYIPPFCNDSGISIGCSLAIKYCILNESRQKYLDLPFGGEVLDRSIISKELSIIRLNEKEFYNLAVTKLKEGRVIGWINGKYELGPRALGNRSILALPLIKGMKDFINQKIKFRESFRPLAPMILEEELENYFYNGPKTSPYMLYNYFVKDSYIMRLKEILHIDGTARVQTVNKTDNFPIYKLLLEVKKNLDIPILFNTSLNVKGKPILNNFSEIYNMLRNTELDSIFFVDDLSCISLKKEISKYE